MNAEQRQTAADLWTKPTDFSHRPACRSLHPPSPSIITQPNHWYSFYHSTEGRRLSRPRWLVTYQDGLPAREHVVTHPSSNRAQCWLTTLIEANALTI